MSTDHVARHPHSPPILIPSTPYTRLVSNNLVQSCLTPLANPRSNEEIKQRARTKKSNKETRTSRKAVTRIRVRAQPTTLNPRTRIVDRSSGHKNQSEPTNREINRIEVNTPKNTNTYREATPTAKQTTTQNRTTTTSKIVAQTI